MTQRPRHHKPLDKRFSAALSSEAYAALRALAEETGLGNNYVLTVLLEEMERTIDRDAFRAAAREMIERHCGEQDKA